ncbi:MAG TPA: hypothetical protein PKA28_04800 [Methylomusa anaerophila]|uniref:Uncharacterized protein n=1 Tax=Methylomusa anaerophila TaxID=1930071 RepID=A0A348AMD9_9FIRM|nr:hypothetical protein [Methylomusa anaerophila]BBB92237.1 hypothetical protein MAMMFC1_02922 [Methylomusa anaerophila]HML87748.1 hypothetical protein [Methylomusa anaerophila]
MLNQYNPFKDNRTEQMRDLWKYYVPFPGLDGAGKPIVVEGGRGSGKTMFFQCNSWRQILSQIRKSEQPTSYLFDKYDFVGIYYRVDTTFVSSMRNREETDWSSIFETYLSICVLQEILELILIVRNDMAIDETEINNFVVDFSKRLNPNSRVDTLLEFRHEIDLYLDAIEDRINGLENNDSFKVRWVNAHRIIRDICIACNRMLKRDILFKIFVDEYETLQDYQQKIINTLIKHSTLPVIFNIGLRPQGMRTNETISATETIEAPHDYEMLTLGIEGSAIYPKILKEICKKRIALGKEQGKIPKSAPEEIEFYLGSYSLEYELERINRFPSLLPHLKKLRLLIQEIGKTEDIPKQKIEECVSILCDQAPSLNSRLHYALLCKKTPFTPTLCELYEAYSSNSKRYNDWMHNRKFGLIFLLCKEAKKEKMYYGFEVYTALSSNIVRYFLELCEQVFRIAFLSNYSWDTMIVPEIQTEAARYVSEYKVVDIAGYEPFGKELRLFIQYIGQIFYRLHTAENNTLGEPEPNHFNTKDLSLSNQTKRLISSAIMWNVLQEGEPTKRKQSKLSPETVDYYINKIYVPYFGISYRNQRKIQLDVDILNQLLSGDEGEAKAGFRNFFKLKEDQPVISENPTHQVSLFDFGQGGGV